MAVGQLGSFNAARTSTAPSFYFKLYISYGKGSLSSPLRHIFLQKKISFRSGSGFRGRPLLGRLRLWIFLTALALNNKKKTCIYTLFFIFLYIVSLVSLLLVNCSCI